MSEQELIAGTGMVAVTEAQLRAEESGRADGLFADPYAQAFVDAAPPEWAPSRITSPASGSLDIAFRWNAVIRTRFFDDYLLAACRAGSRQVVLPGAGLDTRAFRLDWPADTSFFEIDLPAVIDFKEAVLHERAARPRCRRTTLRHDLRDGLSAPLAAAGLDPATPTVWLLEGLLIYLSGEEVERLLGEVTSMSTVGSRVASEHGTAKTSTRVDLAKTMPAMHDYSKLWKTGLDVDSAAWLIAHGWQPMVRAAATVGEAYERPAPPESVGAFLTAVRVRTT